MVLDSDPRLVFDFDRLTVCWAILLESLQESLRQVCQMVDMEKLGSYSHFKTRHILCRLDRKWLDSESGTTG